MADAPIRACGSSKPSLVRRLILGGAAVLAAGAAALARAPVDSAKAPLAAGTAYQAFATVRLPLALSRVNVKVPVPSGKRLDIERVTVTGRVSPGQSGQAPVYAIVLNTTVGSKRGNFPLPQPEFVPFLNAAQPVNLLVNAPMFGAQADGGAKSPTLTIDRTDRSSVGIIAVTLSGRLE